MNMDKYIGKTFPAGKTITELGLDLSRKFVVVVGDNTLNEGDVLVSIDSFFPCFKRLSDGKKAACFPSQLAYLEEEDENEKRWIDGQSKGGNGWAISGLDKPYEPQVGDKISISAVVSRVASDGLLATFAKGTKTEEDVFLYERDYPSLNLTLISRPPRTLTKAEAEKMLSEKLGESVIIE